MKFEEERICDRENPAVIKRAWDGNHDLHPNRPPIVILKENQHRRAEDMSLFASVAYDEFMDAFVSNPTGLDSQCNPNRAPFPTYQAGEAAGMSFQDYQVFIVRFTASQYSYLLYAYSFS